MPAPSLRVQIYGWYKQENCFWEHLFTLTSQGISTFEMEAYQYVKSADDYLQYQRISERVENGLRNVSLLESRCDTDLHEVQTLTEIHKTLSKGKEENFQAAYTQAVQCCNAMKQRLEATASRLKKLLKEKTLN